MKTLVVVLVLLWSLRGHALECYKCDYGCLLPSKTTCGLLQPCVTYKITVGVIPYTKKGCIDASECLSNTTQTYAGVTVKTTPSCCITDLCNSAVVPRMSAITGITVLVTLWLAKLF